MVSLTSIKQLIIQQIENIAYMSRYDMVYEQNDNDQLLIQIIKRDDDGGIMGTPLSISLEVNEESGTGEVVYFHAKGEFKRQSFNVYTEDSLLNVLVFINERLSIN